MRLIERLRCYGNEENEYRIERALHGIEPSVRANGVTNVFVCQMRALKHDKLNDAV